MRAYRVCENSNFLLIARNHCVSMRALSITPRSSHTFFVPHAARTKSYSSLHFDTSHASSYTSFLPRAGRTPSNPKAWNAALMPMLGGAVFVFGCWRHIAHMGLYSDASAFVPNAWMGLAAIHFFGAAMATANGTMRASEGKIRCVCVCVCVWLCGCV